MKDIRELSVETIFRKVSREECPSEESPQKGEAMHFSVENALSPPPPFQ